MDFTINQFTEVAKSNWFNNDIVLSQDRQSLTSKFFHFKSSVPASAELNSKTREAFHEALVREFGIFGEEAFQDNLKLRKSATRSLRKSDILDTVKQAKEAYELKHGGLTAMAESKLTEIVYKTEPFSASPAATKLRTFRYAKEAALAALGETHLIGAFTTQVKAGDESTFNAWLTAFVTDAHARVKAEEDEAFDEATDSELNRSDYSDISSIDEDDSAFLREVEEMEARDRVRRGEGNPIDAEDFEIVTHEQIGAMQYEDEHPHYRDQFMFNRDDSFEDD